MMIITVHAVNIASKNVWIIGNSMNIEALAPGDTVKFSFKQYILIGKVSYVTDYGTVNLVPYFTTNVWSISVDTIIDFVKEETMRDMPEKEMMLFTFGIHMLAHQLNGDVVFIPTGDDSSSMH